jgi:hypothetical protein
LYWRRWNAAFVITALEVALAVILVLVLAVVVLRVRKLRRDEMRALEDRTDPRLVVPPLPPYHPSKGFRLLGESENPAPLREPVRPYLEPDRKYVFNDFRPGHVDVNSLSPARHDEEWALSRSESHSSMSIGGLRLLAVIVMLALVLGVVGFFAHDRIEHNPSNTTTTTSTVTTTTTTPKATTSAG